MVKLRTRWLETLVLSILVVGVGLAASPVATQNTERTYTIEESTLPKSVLEIVEVRHINEENFPTALEVAVKNVGDKPIYGIYMIGIFQGAGMAMPLYFGKPSLAFHTETPTANDQPLLPGETGVLRVEKNIAKGMQIAMANGNLPIPQTLKLQFLFQTLSFGDGTGYQLTDKIGVKKS